MAVKQLSIFVENRTGTLLEITEILASAGVDIRGNVACRHERFRYSAFDCQRYAQGPRSAEGQSVCGVGQ